MELTPAVILALITIAIGGPILLTLWDFLTDELRGRYDHLKEARKRK